MDREEGEKANLVKPMGQFSAIQVSKTAPCTHTPFTQPLELPISLLA